MKRFAAIVAILVVAASLFDSLFIPQHPCEKCGAEMQPFETGSPVYECECGFMVDTAFQR